MTSINPSSPLQPVRVWDLPTRAFHWLLAACVVGLVITGHVGGDALMWHMRLGLTVGALVLFRILWGLVGGRWSRFASFVRGPGTVLRYLRGDTRPGDHFHVGHNPLGAGSVLALLTLLAVQVGTGLLADDEIATTGPLNKYVSTATGLAATSWHKDAGQWILVALVLLHIGAIVFYRVKKGQDLVRPMLVGDKELPADVPASTDSIVTRGLALAIAAACGALAAWVGRLG
ncbi:cytochrome b [Burkholderiales bacterium JOSHI_001]|nr:cytochrome b [Burkholderiales bacterium JOSHI_001]